ncbi:MAG: GumC family protein [Armatimonadota bacterium]
MEFWRYYRIIRRRRWLIILGMVICVGAVAVNNVYFTPSLYTGRTTVMESKGMSREGIPIYAEQQYMMDTQLRLSNLGSIATSQRVLTNAAETLRDLNLSFTPADILDKTSVQPVKDTNILAVEVTLENPQEAKVAADVIAAEFKRAYTEINNSAVKQSREFIEAQLETTRKAMVRAQEALKEYKKQNGIVAIDQQSLAAVQRLSQAKMDLSRAEADYSASSARLGKIDRELQGIPEREIASTQTSRDPVWQQLTQQLVTLETQKAGMTTGLDGQSKRGPNHPEVQALNRQIEDIKKQLARTRQDYVSGKTESKNQVYVNTMGNWVNAKVDSVAAEARLQAMNSVVGEVRGELSSLPEQQAKYAELDTDVASATNTYGLMRSKLDEAKIKEQQVKNEVSLKTIDPAYWYPVNQRKTLKLVMALILSPLLGIGAAFLLFYTDNTTKTPSEAQKLLGVPVLSAVPASRAHSLARQQCPEIVDISYQMLTSNLWVTSQNQDFNAIAMLSAEPDAGRSVTASNLAVALAREGARVVLVDADLRKPTQHLIFGVDNKVGLTNLLSGAASLEDVMSPTRVQGLLLVPSGPVPENPVKFLRAPEMKEFAEQIKALADFVIYDTPAAVTFPDAVLIAAQVGNALVVHSAGRVSRGSEAELHARLNSVGVHELGAVLNKVKREDSSGYFHYNRSYVGVGSAQLPAGKKIRNG